MKKLLLSLFCLSTFMVAKAQLEADNRTISFGTVGKHQNTVKKSISACTVDTIQYTLAKATGLAGLNLNNATSAQSMSQYYNVAQDITVHGATFYAYKTDMNGGLSSNATVSLYLAGTDSMPTGEPLANATVLVDTTFGGGALPILEKSVSFDSPVTVNQPYVIVVSNNSPNGIAVICNSWNSADGAQEWLAGIDLFGTWTRSYNVNVGGVPFDADVIIQSHVSYDLNADFSADPLYFNTAPTEVTFTNNSSPVLMDRMYNVAAFLAPPDLSFTFDFGDGSPVFTGINASNSYDLLQPYTVTLTDTIFGWTATCTSSATVILNNPVDLVISEIMYNPAESGTDTTEFIEIYNNGSEAVNLNNFTCFGGDYTFPDVDLAAGAFYVITVDSSGFYNTYGFDANGVFTNGLSNAGESIVLKNSGGITIDSVFYDDEGVWPLGNSSGSPDGGGSSLVLCDVNSDNSDGANWSASVSATGVIVNLLEVLASPGVANFCCLTTTSVDTQASCDSLEWIDGNTYYSDNNSATFTFTNSLGCDSIVTLNLTVEPEIDITVMNTAPTLTANQTDATYQWLDCNNDNAPIPNETNVSFTATENGSYAVEVTVGNCTATSACEIVTTVGVEDNNIFSAVTVFPNPTKNILNINSGNVSDKVNLAMLSVDGKLVYQKKNMSGNELIIDMNEYSKGIYFLKVEINNLYKVYKVIKD